MTREQLDRLRGRALGDLRHRAVGAGFRHARYVGTPTRDIRAEDKLAQLDMLLGETPAYAADPGYQEPSGINLAHLLIGAAAIGGGYLAGRWFAQHRGRHSLGLDVLGAR